MENLERDWEDYGWIWKGRQAGYNISNDGIDIYQYTANGKKDTGAEATLREHQMNWTGLQAGLYLFVETKVPANVHTTVDPFFVSLPMTDNEGDDWFYDVDVYPKNQTNIPDLKKLVRQHDDAEL